MHAQLTVRGGDEDGTSLRLELGGRCIVGRARDSDLRLRHNRVSRHHVLLSLARDGLHVTADEDGIEGADRQRGRKRVDQSARTAEPAYLGRVFSLTMLAFAGFGLMGLPVGLLADAVGERGALLALAGTVCTIVCGAVLYMVRAAR